MSCKIVVITEKRVTRDSIGMPALWETESSKIIDHDNSSDRKWLGAHAFWAMRNNRKLVTYPVESL